MSELSASAREIIAGRNADPFHYLGPHTENDHTVVRVLRAPPQPDPLR
jgi:1,4-alpha-glucan branching enzyme